MLLALFLLSIPSGTAQGILKTHTVTKGETVYQISRKYKVSVNEIFKLNPNSEKVIYINDILTIPNSNNSSTLNSNNGSLNSTNNSKPLTYTVKKGDTKYGLSKRFGITIGSLEDQNPHINNGLQAGHFLNINSENNGDTKSSNSVVQTNKTANKSHLVLRGETLYGISKKYNLSINELKEANSDVLTDILQTGVVLKIPVSGQDVSNFTQDKYTVRKGDTKYGLSKKFNVSINELETSNPQIVTMLHYGITINVPSSSNELFVTTDSNNPVVNTSDLNKKSSDSIQVVSENNILNPLSGNYHNLSLSIDKIKKNKILIILPFTNNEFDDYINGNSISDHFIKQNIEFYKGAKIAIDSAKSLGLNFEIDLLKIDKSTKKEEISSLSKTKNLETYNGILSPYYKDETKSIADLVSNINIPVVTTLSFSSDKKLNNIYEALPSINIQKLKLIDYLNSKNGNIVLISDIDREENRNFLLIHSPSAKIIKTNKNGRITKNKLVSKLDKTKMNYIIIDSKRNSVFLNSTNLILRELSNYDIQLAVLESSIIPDNKNISSKRFKILKMIYPTLNHSNNNSQKLLFAENYKNSYKSEATENAVFGFDITFDFLLRMSQSISFEETIKKNKTEYLALKFDYRKGDEVKYINNDVLIVEYNNKKSSNEDD